MAAESALYTILTEKINQEALHLKSDRRLTILMLIYIT